MTTQYDDNMKTNPEAMIPSRLETEDGDALVNRIREQEQRMPAVKAPATWKLSKRGKQAVSQGVALFQTQFGIYSAIPMLCKGEECPYAQLYPELHQGVVEEGERCPVEVSFIMTKYASYMKELDIYEDDAVDMSILRDVIDYDIQILRADNRIAVEGGFTENRVVAVGENGQPVYAEEITATANYKDKVQAKRNKSLELLNSTRKDKMGTKINHVLDPSSYGSELLKKFNEREVEANFEEFEVIEDVPYMKQLNQSTEKSRLRKEGFKNDTGG